MMRGALPILVLLALPLFTGPAFAVPDGWHPTLDAGTQAARKSGRPILVVTAWKPNI